MSPEAPPPGEGREPVGSLGEEAVKLFSALQGWAKDSSQDYAGLAADAVESVTESMHQVDQHLATGGEECRYCPVCRAIAAVRGIDPEVRQQLTVAASSLLRAAAGLLATTPPGAAEADGADGADGADDAQGADDAHGADGESDR